MLAIILFGFLLLNIKYHLLNENDNRIINTSGRIVSILSKGDYNSKYLFKAENNDKFIAFIPNDIELEEGSIVSMSGQFKVPSGARNIGGFNYKLYLYSQNVKGSIYVYNKKSLEIIGKEESVITNIRKSILGILGRCFPKEEFGVLLRDDDWRYIIYI